MTTPIFGTDLSIYQRDFDLDRYDKIARSLDFAFVRQSIDDRLDTEAPTHIKRLRARDFVLGQYHYLYPFHAKRQAAVFAKNLSTDGFALDVEESGIKLRDVYGFLAEFRRLEPGVPIGLYTSQAILDRNGWSDLWDWFDWKWEALWGAKTNINLLDEMYRDIDFGRIVHQWGGITFKDHGEKDLIDGNAFRGSAVDLMRYMNGG
jgi:hypothetical protein